MRAFVRMWMLIAVLLGTFALGRSTATFFAEAHAQAGSYYKVVKTPGRGDKLEDYEKLFNEMADQGWVFDNWLYRGSAQAPDMIFRRK